MPVLQTLVLSFLILIGKIVPHIFVMASQIIDYQFTDDSLLTLVCTHAYISNNSTLETLGDLVIVVHIGSELYIQILDITQGQLSTLKSINIDNERLAYGYVSSGLCRFLKYQISRFRARIAQFQQDMNIFSTHSNGRIDYPKLLADFVEAVVGAVFVDSGRNMDATGAVINKLLGPLIRDVAVFGQRPVSQLWISILKNDLKETVNWTCSLCRCMI